MKNLLLLGGLILGVFILSGCKKQKFEEIPEIAPICPEGFYWIESAKSCVLTEDSFVE